MDQLKLIHFQNVKLQRIKTLSLCVCVCVRNLFILFQVMCIPQTLCTMLHLVCECNLVS